MLNRIIFQDQTTLCREFHQMLLAFLLQHDIVNAETYCSDGEGAKPRNQVPQIFLRYSSQFLSFYIFINNESISPSYKFDNIIYLDALYRSPN